MERIGTTENPQKPRLIYELLSNEMFSKTISNLCGVHELTNMRKTEPYKSNENN